MTESKWFSIQANPTAKLRLFLFPYSGGGIQIFRMWNTQLSDSIELCRVQLPGRDYRLSEALYTDIEALAEAIVIDMSPLLDLPFVLFGHSLGAQLSFEVARELRRRKLNLPELLLVSARRAPHLEDALPPVHHLPEQDMLDELQNRYGGIPSAVMENKELRAIYAPILRADLTMIEKAIYRDEPPLNIPISAYSGIDDKLINLQMLKAWERHTAQSFRYRLIAGGHFFINTHSEQLTRAISQDIHATLGI